MSKSILIFLFYYFITSTVMFGQNSKEKKDDQISKIIEEWLIDLNQKGLELRGDSLIVNQEVLRLLNEEEYRRTIYPEVYSWEKAIQFIQNGELKPAFWFFINLYSESEKNKELVLKSVLTYDQLFNMDKLLSSTFYTYGFLDPKIGKIKNGVPEITNPVILEKKLKIVNEIVGYIQLYRSKTKNGDLDR